MPPHAINIASLIHQLGMDRLIEPVMLYQAVHQERGTCHFILCACLVEVGGSLVGPGPRLIIPLHREQEQ